MRKVLYVNPQEQCFRLFPALQSAGWEPHPVRDPGHAHALPPALDCAVGVIRLDQPEDVARLAALDSLIGNGTREWIALLPGGLTAEPRVRRLIADTCFDYLTLPVDPERMLAILGHAHGMAALRRAAPGAADRDGWAAQHLRGNSPETIALRSQVARLAHAQGPVLINGERGSGKALAARAIHEESDRADGPFVVLDCAAISPDFRRFELLGYDQGAMPEAGKAHIGRIEAASGGTLLIEELHDLPIDLQGHLLEFLTRGGIRRMGGTDYLRLDVRVIAATPQDMAQAVAAGHFRADLLQHLAPLQIRVPPLRDRRNDIEDLARHFLQQSRLEIGRGPRHFAPEAMAALYRHHWPGNVEELANRVRRAVVMSEGRLISSADLGLDASDHARAPLTLEQARDRAERHILLDALDRHRGNVTRAARDLDVSRVTLYRLLEKHGIRQPNGSLGAVPAGA
jgi:DNA-binding NtrC family response regulator